MMDALLAAYTRFKTAASPSLLSYAWILPTMPRGVTVAKLEAAGYPQARDLWDGIALAIVLTLVRIALTALVLDRVGRACMKHRYYRIKSEPIPAIDAVLKWVWGEWTGVLPRPIGGQGAIANHPHPTYHHQRHDRKNKLPMQLEKQRLARELGMPVEEVSDYMRRWRNANREAKALHKFTEVRGTEGKGWRWIYRLKGNGSHSLNVNSNTRSRGSS